MKGNTVPALTVFAPAKINLFLAITGRRPDRFHDLLSVVAPLQFGDGLEIKIGEGASTAEAWSLVTDQPDVPVDESNLIVRAYREFSVATGWREPVAFRLEKRIPLGAGLGGGSSNAVAALRGLNRLAGEPLPPAQLAQIAARLGSDCPLFLHDGPVVLRGRGEQIQELPVGGLQRLKGRRVLVFKPAFGIPTPWAYQWMAAQADVSKSVYLPTPVAEERLQAWLADSGAPAEALLFNNLEQPAFAKYVALPALLDLLRRDFGLEPRMTGSGSACFALLSAAAPVAEIVGTIRDAWGQNAFTVDTAIA